MRKNFKGFLGFLFAAAFIIWIAAFSNVTADKENNLKVYFLNVGQGDSQYIKMPNGFDILIDGGPGDDVLQELGEAMAFGDRRIDLVVLSHPHADHISGLIEVIKRYEIGEIWETKVEYSSEVYDNWKNEIKNQNISSKSVKAGDELIFDGGKEKFFVLYPLSSLEKNLPAGRQEKIDNLNNSSIVSMLKSGSFSVLFLGDLEISGQSQVVEKFSNITVLKVAHHGSKNGTDANLLNVTRPALAIITVGKNNFGHPAPSIINLLKSFAIKIYRTDQNGTILVSWDGSNYSVQTDR